MGLLKTQSSYTLLIVCLYANYFLIGIEQIAVAQYMDAFMARLGTDVSNIALIISGTALGRGIGGCFSGFLSDRFGRKAVIVSGTMGLCLSFIGLVTAPTQFLIFMAVFCGGFSDALVDSGAFATFAEAFPRTSASKAVGSKIAISTGQIFFPVFVTWLISVRASFNVSLGGIACLALGNLIFLASLKFPTFTPSKGFFKANKSPVYSYEPLRQPKFVIDGLPLLVFAGFSYISFSIALIWMPLICRDVAQASLAQSLTTVSFFATGSVLFGFVSVYLMKHRVRPVMFMAILPVITAIGAFVAWLWPTLTICRVASFVIGATAAGGVLQIGVSVLIDFFPTAKGRVAMAYMLTSSLTGAVTTFLLGQVVINHLDMLMLINAVTALVNAFVGLIVVVRFYRTFTLPDIRWGESFFRK